MATCEEYREQPKNREKAFERCCNTKKFQVWLKCEIARRSGEKSIEEQVDEMTTMGHLKIEGKSNEGKWEVIELIEE